MIREKTRKLKQKKCCRGEKGGAREEGRREKRTEGETEENKAES